MNDSRRVQQQAARPIAAGQGQARQARPPFLAPSALIPVGQPGAEAATQAPARHAPGAVASSSSQPAVPWLARQVDGHPDVVLKNAPNSEGTFVAKVPNGQPVALLAEQGDFFKVRWRHIEGYCKKVNVSQGGGGADVEPRSKGQDRGGQRPSPRPRGGDAERRHESNDRGRGQGAGQRHGNEQRQGNEQRGGRADAEPASWDATRFRTLYAEAKAAGDDKQVRAALKEVAQSNYRLVQGPFSDDVARTDLVTGRELNTRGHQGHGKDPRYSISAMGTGDALLHYAASLRRSGSHVCALNFANGESVGGGYLRGARAQEEDLCRQFPCLYTSLSRAKDYGHVYPFGPPTYRGGRDPKRYADVLFTSRIVGRRQNQAQGYALIPDVEVLDNMSLVSAAAPNIKGGHDVFDPELVKQAMVTILLAPKLKSPKVDTLILGAWGCGAFGCDPAVVAKLFAEVLLQGGLGRTYREIHFAIPDGADRNLQIFDRVLREAGIRFSAVGAS